MFPCRGSEAPCQRAIREYRTVRCRCQTRPETHSGSGSARTTVHAMQSRLAAIVVKNPSAVLLSVQLLSILLFPLMDESSEERAVFRVIGLLVLGAALYVVKRGPWLTPVAMTLALPVVMLSFWQAV